MATGNNKKGLKYKQENENNSESPPSYSVYDTGIQLETINPNFHNDVYNAGYDQHEISTLEVVITDEPKVKSKKSKKSKVEKEEISTERPQSWVSAAICACIFCFFPTGIGAIIAAMNAQEAYKDGEYEEARRTTNVAKHLTIASMVIGFLLIVVLAMTIHFHIKG